MERESFIPLPRQRFQAGDWVSFDGVRNPDAESESVALKQVLRLEEDCEGKSVFTARVFGFSKIGDGYVLEFHDAELVPGPPIDAELLRRASDAEIQTAIRRDVPDYEMCSCGFDHNYEPEQAAKQHNSKPTSSP